uniref:Cysteine-rich receptor-like protein kinase n=1 Tax=Hordeum vulgare subsp. vulgare TaxID=112509 RepID=A0A8I6X4Y3_HORVV
MHRPRPAAPDHETAFLPRPSATAGSSGGAAGEYLGASVHAGRHCRQAARPCVTPAGVQRVPSKDTVLKRRASRVCGSTGSFPANSTYQANLGLLAGALPKNASSSPDLFATAVVGAVPDQVSALALSRGDANATACSGCLAAAFHDAQNLCAYAKDAALYYEHEPCILYYSNVPFLSSPPSTTSGPGCKLAPTTSSRTPAGSTARWLRSWTPLPTSYAAYNSTRRYASGEADLDVDSEFPRVYSWAQCTPDLTPAQCHDCLAGIITRMPRFADRIGAKILVREPATLAQRGKLRNKTVLVLAIVLALFVAILAITTICLCYSRKKRTRSARNLTDGEDIVSIDSLIVDLPTLRGATDDFAEANKLGEGGFGVVYKGNLPDGREIAVKRLSRSSAQGIGELKNELALVAKLQHKNLVRLVGVCVQEHEKLLAYEYMPNKSIDTIIFGNSLGNKWDCSRIAISS